MHAFCYWCIWFIATKDKEKQTAVSTILSVLDRFALRVYDKSDPDLETRGFRKSLFTL